MNRGIISLLLVTVFVVAGCTVTSTQKGAMVGAVGGAILGQATGEDTKSTLLGAAAGAIVGALVGEQLERQKKESGLKEFNENYSKVYLVNESQYRLDIEITNPNGVAYPIEVFVGETKEVHGYILGYYKVRVVRISFWDNGWRRRIYRAENYETGFNIDGRDRQYQWGRGGDYIFFSKGMFR